jgi:hypothetical protein
MEGDKLKQKEEAPLKAPVKRFSDEFYIYTFKIAPCKAEYPVGARLQVSAPALVCTSHTRTRSAYVALRIDADILAYATSMLSAVRSYMLPLTANLIHFGHCLLQL